MLGTMFGRGPKTLEVKRRIDRTTLETKRGDGARARIHDHELSRPYVPPQPSDDKPAPKAPTMIDPKPGRMEAPRAREGRGTSDPPAPSAPRGPSQGPARTPSPTETDDLSKMFESLGSGLGTMNKFRIPLLPALIVMAIGVTIMGRGLFFGLIGLGALAAAAETFYATANDQTPRFGPRIAAMINPALAEPGRAAIALFVLGMAALFIAAG